MSHETGKIHWIQVCRNPEQHAKGVYCVARESHSGVRQSMELRRSGMTPKLVCSRHAVVTEAIRRSHDPEKRAWDSSLRNTSILEMQREEGTPPKYQKRQEENNNRWPKFQKFPKVTQNSN